MRYCKFILLLLSAAVFTASCSEQSKLVSLKDANPAIGLGEPLSMVESPPAGNSDISEIAEPSSVITLRQALALALIHNPGLKAFSWEVRATEARQLQAGLWPNPGLEVEVEEVGGPGQRSGFDGAQTTIQLSQLIEMGEKRSKRIKLASFEKELVGWDYEAKRLDVLTKVVKGFVEVLAAQQRRKLTEELLQLSEELVDTVTKRVDAGKDSPLEKTKATVALSNISIQHQQALQNLDFARRQLASTWASKEPMFEGAVGQFDLLSPIPSIGELTDLIAKNPDVVRLSIEIEKNKAALELEKAKAVSDITLSGGMQRFNETDDNAIVFGISIPLPISDRNQAGKLQATYELAKAREEKKATLTRIQTELAKAYQAVSNAYTEASELDKNILQEAESVFEASKTGYNRGKLDYLNVLDAQRTMFDAKAQYIDALASYHIAKADVERLIGQNLDGIENSPETKTEKSK